MPEDNSNTYEAAIKRGADYFTDRGLSRQRLQQVLQPTIDGDSNLVRHASEQLMNHGLFAEDSDYDGMIGVAVLDLIALFALQHHSGESAAIVIELFQRLAKFEEL